MFSPGTLRSGAALLSRAGASLSLPAKGPPRLHSPASVARRASTCPSIQKPQKDFLTGSRSSDNAGFTALLDENCEQTDTDTKHPYELLVPLRQSQCSWSSDMTERGSLQAKHPSPNLPWWLSCLPVKLLFE